MTDLKTDEVARESARADQANRDVAPPEWQPCPFDVRLARTPYLVLPKLALQAMPMHWRKRFESLLVECDEAGLETPSYLVFRDEEAFTAVEREDSEDIYSGVAAVTKLNDDPWANYRYGDIGKLCPSFKAPRVSDEHSQSEDAQRLSAEHASAATLAETPALPSPEVDKLIEEHRIACAALTVRAMDLNNDGEQIRRELDEADAKLRDGFLLTTSQHIEKLEKEREEALTYATRLATILWQKHYAEDAPNWSPLEDLVGVLTQIDNMACGLSRSVALQQQCEALKREILKPRLFQEHRERLEMMGEGNPKWDLSPNDRAAINQALWVIDDMTKAALSLPLPSGEEG